MSNENNTGVRIALWNVNSDNPNSPCFNGIVTIDGVEHKVSLWDNASALHPKAPAFKGKTSRPSPKEVFEELAPTATVEGGIYNALKSYMPF